MSILSRLSYLELSPYSQGGPGLPVEKLGGPRPPWFLLPYSAYGVGAVMSHGMPDGTEKTP